MTGRSTNEMLRQLEVACRILRLLGFSNTGTYDYEVVPAGVKLTWNYEEPECSFTDTSRIKPHENSERLEILVYQDGAINCDHSAGYKEYVVKPTRENLRDIRKRIEGILKKKEAKG